MALRRVLLAAACMAAALSMPATAAPAKAKDHIQHKIRAGEVAVHSVNLGSWLVAEYWMSFDSPLWEGVPENVARTGEYGVMKFLGKEKGTKNFENHWSTWIVEKDIEDIANAGLNTVRVSIGYWIVNDEDDSKSSDVSKTFAKGGLRYLDTLINKWAVKYNVAVMLSLHAHEGSQNGLDHSAPVEMWKTQWSDKPENVQSSMLVATFIAKRYKNSPAFLGLNLMNEPTNPVNYGVLEKYYKDAYKSIRETGNDCIIATSPWLQHQSPEFMSDFMVCPEYYNVWHEFHVYYKWGWEHAPKEAVFSEAAKYKSSHITGWKGNPLFIGEWSLATADSLSLSDEELGKFADIQMKEYNDAGAGWAFWAYRHSEDANKTSGWSMRQLLKKGLIKVPTNTALNANLPSRSKHVNCAPARNETSEDSASGSGSGSVAGDVKPDSLFTPERVSPADTDKANVTTPPKSTDAAKSSASTAAASALGLTVAAVMAAWW
ncbi:hypothetical protein P43SY_005850 [Pythium insidiosum]|uniref:glucan 1,3-beta-glucosidase n=1 Tax=Pythium insidiosum TaxID=114742 RepID=A0AAD5M9Y9_PYTIN|nr:hypothetical protein P43SY_005850 [Pythium insidiosum]